VRVPELDIADVLAGVGLIMLAIGLYFAWAPLALIVPGVVLLALGIMGSR